MGHICPTRCLDVPFHANPIGPDARWIYQSMELIELMRLIGAEFLMREKALARILSSDGRFGYWRIDSIINSGRCPVWDINGSL